MSDTSIVTKTPVRLSYPALFEPRSMPGSEDEKYGATLLIPKTAADTVNAIWAAEQIAEAQGVNGEWKGAKPPLKAGAMCLASLYDGDGIMPNTGALWGEECKGHYVLRTSSKNRPGCVDERGQKVLDPSKFYPGCYVYASINFFVYSSNGNRGVGCGLNNIMFAKDGDPLGNASRPEIDFADMIAANMTAQPPMMPQPMQMQAPVMQAPMMQQPMQPMQAPVMQQPMQMQPPTQAPVPQYSAPQPTIQQAPVMQQPMQQPTLYGIPTIPPM